MFSGELNFFVVLSSIFSFAGGWERLFSDLVFWPKLSFVFGYPTYRNQVVTRKELCLCLI